MYVLDTDVAVFLLRGRAPMAEERLRSVDVDAMAITAISAAELRFGAAHSPNPPRNLEFVEHFLAPLRMLPFDGDAAVHFAAAKQHLARRGLLIGPMDLLIAATVLSCGAVLVTNNVSEFSRVPSLRVENWMNAR